MSNHLLYAIHVRIVIQSRLIKLYPKASAVRLLLNHENVKITQLYQHTECEKLTKQG